MDRPIRLTSLTGVGESRFRVEILDDDVLVLDTHLHLIHRVNGADVDDLVAGRPCAAAGHLPAESLPALRAALDGQPVARRRVLISGGALAASGIVTLGLPFAAAAASRDIVLTGGETMIAALATREQGGFQPFSSFNALDPATIAGSTVQVLLRATNGGDGGASQPGFGGRGAYVAVTISNIPTSGGRLRCQAAVGGYADDATNDPEGSRWGGFGGIAAAIGWTTDNGSSYTWLAVAGAGGGAGGGLNGGDAGQDGGGGARGGKAGTTSSEGAAGTGGHGDITRQAYAGGPATASSVGSRFSHVSSLGGVSETAGSGRLFGGGGGAGYYQGGGGLSTSTGEQLDGGGGGGGSTYFRTTPEAGLPNVTSSSVYLSGAPLTEGATAFIYYTSTT